MSNRPFIRWRRHLRITPAILAVVAVVSVAVCGSANHDAQPPATTSSSTTATTAPATTAPSTSEASPTPIPESTQAATSTTQVPVVESEQHDGTTEARLRVVLADVDGPNIDLYVNGTVAVNGGQSQLNIPVGYTTAYLYLPPGPYEVAVTPTGSSLAQALAAPVDVPMVAGHRYLIAFMGRIADHSLTPLVIDETKAAADVGANQPVAITLNNLTGSTGLDVEWAGKPVNTGIPDGGYGAGTVRAGGGHLTMTARGASDTVLIDEDNYAAVGDGVGGAFGHDYTAGGGFGLVDAAPTSELSVADWLDASDPANLIGPSADLPSFKTVRQAIETAGLTEFYNGHTLLFLPPTDQAFTDMPTAQRDAMLADPAALADMLRAHTIAAYVPRGSLVKTPGAGGSAAFDRVFTNLLGDTIHVGSDFSINGGAGGFGSTWLSNGTQIHPVATVIFPPAQPPISLPAPGPDQPSDAIAAKADILATFDRLTDPATPDPERLALIDDTQGVQEALEQARANFPDQASVHITIEQIVFLSPSEASFLYTLHSSGGDFAGELGGARLIEDTWKLTRNTICQDTAKAGGICSP